MVDISVVMVYSVIVIIFLLLGFGAVILRVACSMVGVDIPEFGRAMMITFLAWIANAAMIIVINLVIVVVMSATGGNPQAAQITASVLSLPVILCFSAAIYSFMLETKFGKGILILLVQQVVLIIIAASVYAIVWAIYTALGVAMF